ncbi:helix-turn-helix transcriptional regulator [Actinomadura sp. WMMA1423]|uniref:helix-turn-helix transcriptional regulator n=1 Tax=Actinomadura sp. WMMA1423 TaxID=2591108 RepID=UPI0011461832|nr:helix-turn-helix transcriptional regulator [Actinomadura sp. WMMA1423]
MLVGGGRDLTQHESCGEADPAGQGVPGKIGTPRPAGFFALIGMSTVPGGATDEEKERTHMNDGGMVGRIRERRHLMAARGATVHEIAATLIAEFDVNPRVAYRHALGLTQKQVAEAYNRRWPEEVIKTRKEISYWERWGGPGRTCSSSSARAPSHEHLARLAQLYGCLVDDLLFGPRRNANPPETTIPFPIISEVLSNLAASDYADNPGHDDPAAITLRALIGEGTIIVRLTRRRFTELLAATGLAALLPDALPGPALADAVSGAEAWRRTLVAHQSGHHLMAPRVHIMTLADVLTDISAARSAAGPGQRPELLQLEAEYAEHISWLYRESGDTGSSWRWADRANSLAAAAGDNALAAYMTLRRSAMTLDGGDYATAGALAEAAERTESIPPALVAVAQLYRARAQAATGTLAEASLDRADELLDAAHQPQGPAFLRFYTPAFAELQRATCYLAAGRPSRAVTILQARLTGLPNIGHRDRAIHLARLGAAHAADRAPDAAAIAGLGALTEASRVRSLHALRDLHRLDTSLTSWRSQPKVSEFHDALQTAARDLGNR